MKKALKFLFLIAVSATVQAQTCVEWYPVKSGNSWEVSHYDKKDKLTGVSVSTITAAEALPTGFSASVAVKSLDAKGKDEGTANIVLKCIDGKFMYDMKNFIDPSSTGNTEGMEISVESTDMEYPGTLTAGQTLPDASITYTIKSNGMTIMTMITNITNRKVIGQESVTTPAGTFDSWKITYDLYSKNGFVKMNISVVDFLSVGAGVVRSESYNDKGELTAYSLLTKLVR